MKKGLTVLFLVLVFGFTGKASAQLSNEARASFYQGNTYYTEEKFEQAIANYEDVLSLGFQSGPLYYNLGNAYFKTGNLGKAILNYLRAQRLMPRDADLKSNLDYAQSLIAGGQVQPKKAWFTRTFFNFAGAFSLDEATLLSFVLYFICAILVILMILTKDGRKILVYITASVFIALVVFFSVFFVLYQQIVLQKQAVVIVEASDSKFEPLEDATTFFSLSEGEAVTVIGENEDWVKVKRVDARQGWIKKSDIEFL